MLAGSPPVMVSGAARFTLAVKAPTSFPPLPFNVYEPPIRAPLLCIPGRAPNPEIGRLYRLLVSVKARLVMLEPLGPVRVSVPASKVFALPVTIGEPLLDELDVDEDD